MILSINITFFRSIKESNKKKMNICLILILPDEQTNKYVLISRERGLRFKSRP
jgi:hypothetical protein